MGGGKARLEVWLTDLAHSLKKAFRPLRAPFYKPNAIVIKFFKWTVIMLLNYALS
jgi:hypothetical protein